MLELTSYLKKQLIVQNITKLKNNKIAKTHDQCLEHRQNNMIIVKHLNKKKRTKTNF